MIIDLTDLPELCDELVPQLLTNHYGLGPGVGKEKDQAKRRGRATKVLSTINTYEVGWNDCKREAAKREIVLSRKRRGRGGLLQVSAVGHRLRRWQERKGPRGRLVTLPRVQPVLAHGRRGVEYVSARSRTRSVSSVAQTGFMVLPPSPAAPPPLPSCLLGCRRLRLPESARGPVPPPARHSR